MLPKDNGLQQAKDLLEVVVLLFFLGGMNVHLVFNEFRGNECSLRVQ